MLLTHIAIYTFDIIALLMLFGLLTKDNLLSKQLKQSFKYGIMFTILIIFAEFGTIFASEQGANFRNMHMLFNAIGFSLSPLVPIVLVAIFDPNILKKYKYIFLPTVINGILSILSPWFGLIFFVDSANVYERGSVFLLFIMFYIVNIIILVFVAWHNSKKRFYPIKWKIAGLSLFTIIGTGVQILIPQVYSSWHCVTLSLLLFYILLSEFEANFDALTGLNNRLSFEKASRNLSGKKKYSLIAMDINDFKEVNDIYGHGYGDIVLKDIAEIIKQIFVKNSTSYRIGGDEFCIIIKDDDEDKVKESLDFMDIKVKKKRKEVTWFPIMSYGYKINKENENIEFVEAFKIADQEMYKHKQSLKKKNN